MEGRSQSADESRAAAEPSMNTGTPTALKESSEDSHKGKRLIGWGDLEPSK